jgi:hypothetical protein
MYSLHVHYADKRGPRVTHTLDRAADVLSRIADLLREHQGCEKIVILTGTTLMFAVDCNGNQLTA